MEIDNLISQNKTGTKLEMCTKLIAIQNSSTQYTDIVMNLI